MYGGKHASIPMIEKSLKLLTFLFIAENEKRGKEILKIWESHYLHTSYLEVTPGKITKAGRWKIQPLLFRELGARSLPLGFKCMGRYLTAGKHCSVCDVCITFILDFRPVACVSRISLMVK